MMQGHLTAQEVESYRRRAVDAGERSAFDQHLAACDACLRRVADTTRSDIAFASLTEAFLPAGDEEAFHLSREELKRYAEGSLDEADNVIFESHLEDCVECGSTAREMLSIRPGRLARREDERAGYAPKTVRERFADAWRGMPSLRPVHVGAVALACACVLLSIFWLQSRFADRPNQSTPPQIAARDTKDQNQPATLSRDEQPGNQSPAATVLKDDKTANGEASDVTSTVSQQKQMEAEPEVVARLIDGDREVRLDKRGRLTGLGGLDLSIQREIKAALSGNELKRPGALDELSVPRINLMNPSPGSLPFELLDPTRRIIVDDRPTFHWRHLAGATGYTVSVFDSNFNLVMRSEPQPVTRWSPPASLQRGRIYFWEVKAIKDGQEITSPVAPAPRAQFKILEAEKAGEINRVKRERPDAHLALGILYANVGLLDDAEREFQLLAKANPRSQVAAKLLRRVRSWKKP